MGLDKAQQLLRLPRREDGHFLSLIGGLATLLTVFFLFVSTGEQARFDGEDRSVVESATTPYVWRRRSLERYNGQAVTQSFATAEPGYISSNSRGTLAAVADERALVLYVYSAGDPVHQNNLNYFVQHGISASDGCDYVFVVQGAENTQASKSLPKLPPNAQYFYANDSSCEPGLGLAAKALNSSLVKKADYAHFFFMSSAFRGPFIPTYALEEHHWTRYFTRRLTEKVKLVGPTISCHVPRFPDGLQQMDPVPPHVQFSVLATDQVGLGVLEAAGEVMQCQASPVDAAFHSSLGASAAMLRANYSLDSFMTRYRNVDWSDPRAWECNSRKEPLAEFAYDGASITPYETMFVPMDTIAIENGWSFAKMAALYETWLTLQDRGDLDISTNQWVSDPWPTKLQRIAYAQARGPGCFDNHYYLQKNADLKVIPNALELWNHFVLHGQFEGRSHRWSCEDDRKLS